MKNWKVIAVLFLIIVSCDNEELIDDPVVEQQEKSMPIDSPDGITFQFIEGLNDDPNFKLQKDKIGRAHV